MFWKSPEKNDFFENQLQAGLNLLVASVSDALSLYNKSKVYAKEPH
tara:strand:+ start:222 stop:359 length:138 start_codon:yes stop_codon:yes gene_type:complete